MADLVKRYDIDRFLVSAGTAVASAAAEAFIEEFPSTRSPLVLYGPPGAGKSHLLHAIGNAVAAGEKAARVLLLAPGGPGPEEGGPGPTLVLVDDVGPEHAAWLERMAARPGALWCWTTPTDPRGWPGPPEGLRAWVDQGRIMDLAPAGVEVLEALVDEWLDRRGGHLDAGLRAFLFEHFGGSPGRLLAALERLWAHRALGAPQDAVTALAPFIDPRPSVKIDRS